MRAAEKKMKNVKLVNFSEEKSRLLLFLLSGVFLTVLFFAQGFFTGSNAAATQPQTHVILRTEDTGTTESGSSGSGLEEFGVTMNSDGTGITVTGVEGGDSVSTWTNIFQKYKTVIIGISGIMFLTFFVFFLLNLGKVGASADNPTERRRAIIGVIVTAIITGVTGSATVFFALAWNAFK